MIIVDLTQDKKCRLDGLCRVYHEIMLKRDEAEMKIRVRIEHDNTMEILPSQTPSAVEERYAIVSAYLQNQTDENWERLVKQIKGVK